MTRNFAKNRHMKAPRSIMAQVFAVISLVLLAGGLRAAENLDSAVLHHASDMLKFVNDQRYRNVGVLKVRVKTPTRSASFEVAPFLRLRR